jgi:phosphoglycolate phosphatase
MRGSRLTLRRMLILFDIDGTLLNSNGAGQSGFVAAGRQLYGKHFTLDGISLAGRLDRLILNDALDHAEVPLNQRDEDRFRDAYVAAIRAEFKTGRRVCKALNGALTLVDQVVKNAGMTCGLLTGNWCESGRIKLEAAGYDLDAFEVQSWAGDADDRPGLVAVALDRWGRGSGGDAIIVGDTPHDVSCGRAHGCRTLAVATGPYERSILDETAADLVVDDLGDTDALMAWFKQSHAS